MKQTTQRNRSEEAVSPVVGVMLMLVVTIIIAAVVSSFAGGLATSTEKAPNAVLDVKIYEQYTNALPYMGTYNYPSFQIKMLGGETLDTSKMKLKFSWTNTTSGDECNSTYSGDGTFKYTSYYSGEHDMPAMAILQTSGNIYDQPSNWFGNVTIANGDVLQSMGLYSAYTNSGENPLPLEKDESFKIIFGDDYTSVIKGTPIHVVIMYNEHVVFDKEVIVA